MRLVSLIALLTLVPSGSTHSGKTINLSSKIGSSANQQYGEQKSSVDGETEDLVKRNLHRKGDKGSNRGKGSKAGKGGNHAYYGYPDTGYLYGYYDAGLSKGAGKGSISGPSKGANGLSKGCDAARQADEVRRLKAGKGKGSKGKGSKGKGSKGKGSKGKGSKGKGGKDGKGHKGSYYGYGKGGYGYGKGKGSNYYGKGKGADYYEYSKGKGVDYYGYGYGKGKGSNYYGKGKGADYYEYSKGKGVDYYGYGYGKGKGSNYYGKGKGSDYYGTSKGCDPSITPPTLAAPTLAAPTLAAEINPPEIVRPPQPTRPPFAPSSNDDPRKSKAKSSKDSKDSNKEPKESAKKSKSSIPNPNLSKSSKSSEKEKGKQTKDAKSENKQSVVDKPIVCTKEGFNGQTNKKPMRFEYAIQTNNPNADSIVKKLETEISNLIAAKVCKPSPKSRRSLQTPDVIPTDRRLAIIGIDSKPKDIIKDSNYCIDQTPCCNGNCHKAAADMTLITDQENSDEQICAFLTDIISYMDKLQPNDIDGLQKAYFLSSDTCKSNTSLNTGDGRGSADVIALQNRDNSSESNDDPIFHKLFWPLIILLLLLICCCLYVRMRRSREIYDDDDLDKITVSSVDGDISADTSTLGMKSMNYAEKQRFLSSVDVKKCASLACFQCNTTEGTKFVGTDKFPSTPSTIGTTSPQQWT